MTKAKHRKLLALGVSALAIVAAFGLAACGSGSGSSGSAESAAASGAAAASSEAAPSADAQDITLTVAAVPTPHAEILNDVVAPQLAEQGITLKVIEFNDYVQPNTVTEEGEVDANYFQHGPYLESFNEENGTHLVSVAAVHYEPFGLYSNKIASIDEVSDGAIVAIPNDTTNEARALLLLAQEGLIEIDPDAGITATPQDVTSNPKNLEFKELEAAQTARVLDDVEIAAINSNYAIEAGLTPATDALAIEDASGDAAQTYANLLVVKEGNENAPGIPELAAAITSPEVKTYIEENYKGAVEAIF